MAWLVVSKRCVEQRGQEFRARGRVRDSSAGLDMAVRDTLDQLHKDRAAENDKIDAQFYELQSGEQCQTQ